MKDRIVTWALCLALAVPLAASANKGAMTLTGTDDEYAPLLTANPSGALFQGTVLLGSRFEHVSPYPVDIDGTELGTDLATDLVARVGLRFDSKRSMAPVGLGVRLEVDAITGTVSSAPTLEGEGLPGSHGYENVIRRANLRFSVGTYFHIFAGFMMSDFGMGLIANDGTHHWEPGNALFNDPHGGDRVLRGMIASGPLTAARMVIGVGYGVAVAVDEANLDTAGTTPGEEQAGKGELGSEHAWKLPASTLPVTALANPRQRIGRHEAQGQVHRLGVDVGHTHARAVEGGAVTVREASTHRDRAWTGCGGRSG